MNINKISLVLLFTFAFGLQPVYAQEFHVTKSEVFEEPGTGWNKILQLKNGITFLLHIDEKADGIDLTVFDKNRKTIRTGKLVCKVIDLDKMRSIRVPGVYEINGEPVLFIIAEDNDKAGFYRVRLDPATGLVIKEDKIGVLEDDAYLYRHAFVSEGISGMSVAKDPASDYYAVVLTKWDRKEGKQSFKVLYFDGIHTKINECSYNPNSRRNEYAKFGSAVVDGSKAVFLFCGGADSKLAQTNTKFDYFLVMKMTATDKQLTITSPKLNIENTMKDMHMQALYDKVAHKVQLFAVWVDHTEYRHDRFIDYYLAMIIGFDATTQEVSYVKPIDTAKVNAYARQYIDDDYKYIGAPGKVVRNRDNSVAVLSEIRLNGFLSDMAVLQLSDTVELAGCVIEKRQEPTSFTKNDQFRSFDYFSASKGNYVMINDVPSNFNRKKNEKIRSFTTASATNAVAYKLGNNEPERFFPFGAPGEDSNTFAYLEGADYNDALNTYATIIVERNGREKQAHMAWVTFE